MQLFSQICHRDTAMAIACFKSLEKSWQEPWTLHFLEDGSVTGDDWDQLRAAFPEAVFHRKTEIKDQVEASLARHPVCLEFYRGNVLSPRLFEGPLLSGGDFHYCDADLLFFRRIKHLWPAAPGLLFLTEDQPRFTGFSHHVSEWAFRRRIPLAENLNAGMFRIPRQFHDLDKMEWFLNWARHPRYPFLVEQTYWSFLAAGAPHRRVAPDEILCTKTPLPEKNLPPAIHFIAGQKAHFWKFAERVPEELEKEPINDLRTVEGRKVRWNRVAVHVAKGLPGRLAQVLKIHSSA